MEQKQRVYFVIDMKSFFASVECAARGLDAMTTNLVVADLSRTDKTICLAVSPSMKALGVRNRCRLFEIPKNLEYIVAKPRMKKYIECSANIYGMYLEYMSKDDIYAYSIDECILDVTDYLKLYQMRAKDYAKLLMKEIHDRFGIPATCGIGTNMYLAKIALDITAKHSPDRIGWLTEEKFLKTLSHHTPLNDFWQISSGTVNHLARLGIFDMEGIRNANEDLLYQEFGVKAELLIDHAKGIEPVTIKDIHNYQGKSKSVSQGQVLACAYSFEDAQLVLKEMLQSGCDELARKHLVSEQIGLVIRYQDKTSAHGSVRLSKDTNLYRYMIDDVLRLYRRIVYPSAQVKGIMLDFMNVEPDYYEQYDLFTNPDEVKEEKSLRDSLLDIQKKYGKNMVLKARDYQEKATARERNKQIGGHNSGENEDDHE